MSLVALDGTPLVVFGGTRGDGSVVLPSNSNVTQDAANEACIMIGRLVWSDGGTHTVDTTGSSSLGCRIGARTFSNVGTTFVVGLATVDTATGPPGRATNVADVITPSVSRSYTSAAPPAANAWLNSVPTSGSLSIASGDELAFFTQMTTRGGTDSVITTVGTAVAASYPSTTSYIGGVYTAVSSVPNAEVIAADGTRGYFMGGTVFTTTLTLQTWNNASSPNEYGNFFQMPFPGKIYGLIINVSVGGNFDGVLYSDPLGTPVSQKTCSVDLNTVSSVSVNGNRINVLPFATPYSFTANQPLAGIIKPTSATSVDAIYMSMDAAAQMGAWPLGTNCYAINRASGAFAAQNSSKDRFGIGVLIGAFDDGTSTGGGPVGQQLGM